MLNGNPVDRGKLFPQEMLAKTFADGEKLTTEKKLLATVVAKPVELLFLLFVCLETWSF